MSNPLPILPCATQWQSWDRLWIKLRWFCSNLSSDFGIISKNTSIAVTIDVINAALLPSPVFLRWSRDRGGGINVVEVDKEVEEEVDDVVDCCVCCVVWLMLVVLEWVCGGVLEVVWGSCVGLVCNEPEDVRVECVVDAGWGCAFTTLINGGNCAREDDRRGNFLCFNCIFESWKKKNFDFVIFFFLHCLFENRNHYPRLSWFWSHDPAFQRTFLWIWPWLPSMSIRLSSQWIRLFDDQLSCCQGSLR